MIKRIIIVLFIALAITFIGGCEKVEKTDPIREGLIRTLQSLPKELKNQDVKIDKDTYKIGDFHITFNGSKITVSSADGQQIVLCEFEEEILRVSFIDNDNILVEVWNDKFTKHKTYTFSTDSVSTVTQTFPETLSSIEEMTYHKNYILYHVVYAPYEAEAIGGISCIYSKKRDSDEEPKKIIDYLWDWRFTDDGIIYSQDELTWYICDFDGGNNREYLETSD